MMVALGLVMVNAIESWMDDKRQLITIREWKKKS